jgi:hypothetical protein
MATKKTAAKKVEATKAKTTTTKVKTTRAKNFKNIEIANDLNEKSYIKLLLSNTGKNKMETIADLKKRFRNKFSNPQMFDITKITTKPQIFQGRTVPFAEETVRKIINEGFDTSQEPIILFKDGSDNIVISGHSRFEAAKTLYKAGDTTLKKIPVKFFVGDLDDAIDYAVIESNRSGKAEGIESDIKAYLRARQRGYNKDKLLGIFKTNSYINILDALSHLNAKGDFITNLIEEDKRTGNSRKKEKSFPFLLRTSQWIGNLRKRYKELTNAHEQELFKFFYGGGPGLKIKYSDFMDKITAKIENPKWTTNKGLALSRESVFDIIHDKDPLWIAYKSRLTAIKNSSEERLQLEKKWVQSIIDNNTKRERELKSQVDQITKQIHEKIKETTMFIGKLAKEDKNLSATALFK